MRFGFCCVNSTNVPDWKGIVLTNYSLAPVVFVCVPEMLELLFASVLLTSASCLVALSLD